MLGGGDFKVQNAKSFRECRKLVKSGNSYKLDNMANMLYQRHGHSACAFGAHHIVVTGGRHGTGHSSEIYEINNN